MKKIISLSLFLAASCSLNAPVSGQEKENIEQARLTAQAINEVGLPAIKNFQEKRLLKDILEMRDSSIATYTYLVSEYSSKLTLLCHSIGFGIPAATQFTNPQKELNGYQSITTIPQADPNGLYSPTSAEGTWVLCKNPNGSQTKPVYVEPRVIVSPFPF